MPKVNIEKALRNILDQVISIEDFDEFIAMSQNFEQVLEPMLRKIREERSNRIKDLVQDKDELLTPQYAIINKFRITRELDPNLLEQVIKDEDNRSLFYETKPVTVAKAERLAKRLDIDKNIFKNKQAKTRTPRVLTLAEYKARKESLLDS